MKSSFPLFSKNRVVGLLDKCLSTEYINYQQVIAIIIPVLIDQAFIVCLNMLNTAMISSSGAAAVSAVSMVDSLNLFLLNIFISIATGGTVVVAQYKGSHNDAMASKSTAQAVAVVGLSGIVIAAVMILFHSPALSLLFSGAEADVMENARIYFLGSCISYPCYALYQAVCCSLRGVGHTKSSMMLSIITNISYVLLNVVFITILQMGVLGLSISLNLSRLLGMLCSIVYLLKFENAIRIRLREIFKFDFSIQKKILFIGIPFATEQVFFHGGKIITQTFIVQLGTFPMAANAICNSFMSLYQIPAQALNLSIVTVVGQCIGADDQKGARKLIKSFLGMGFLTLAVFALMIVPVFSFLLSLFSPDPQIVPDIYIICTMIAIAQPFLWPISFITPSSLRAAGDSKYTTVVSLISMWSVRVLLGYVLGIVLHFGLLGVWIAMLIEWGVRGIIFLWRFKGSKWCSHRLIEK